MKRQRAKSQTISPTTNDEPPPKKVVKKIKPPVGPTSLGSLPLFGERVPQNGYTDVPSLAQTTCDEIRAVINHVNELKQTPESSKADADSLKQNGVVLFATLRKLNRLSHLYCKDSREQTNDQKLEVDDLHLQLQNLMYEAAHLRKEITNCLEFRSQHEEIDLVSEEDFYTSAPESISKPEKTKSDQHLQMLSRLEWELEQRKQLASQLGQLEDETKLQEEKIKKKQGSMAGLQPALENLRKATLPIEECLEVPLDHLREEQAMAVLLPVPLYIFYNQAKAYGEVEDNSLTVDVLGDVNEAKAFSYSSSQDDQCNSQEEESDSDAEGGKEENSRRKKRSRRQRGKSSPEQKDVSKPHPLSVSLTISIKAVGSVQVIFSYLPYFSVVCAAVTSISLVPPALESDFVDKSALLHCLFEGDTGRTSPNPVVSFHIRKHKGEVFSSAVRQHGFPYKWTQRVCGVSVMPESMDATAIQPHAEASAESIGEVVCALKQRFVSQVNVAHQLSALAKLKTSLDNNSDETSQSQLVQWKSILAQDAQNLQFGSLGIFNFQERTNRFYLVALQSDHSKMHCLVCIGMDYPDTAPSFAVMVERKAGQRDKYDIQLKNIEAEANVRFPNVLRLTCGRDELERTLLFEQLKKLKEVFDTYLEYCRIPHSSKAKLPNPIRGKGRLLSYS